MEYKEKAFEVSSKSCARCGQEPGMISAIAAALREAAAQAYEDAARSVAEPGNVTGGMAGKFYAKSASLRNPGGEG